MPVRELSKKSKYWIPKDRFLELKHFVRQYDYFKMLRNDIYTCYPTVKYAVQKGVHVKLSSDPVYSAYARAMTCTKYLVQIEEAFKRVGLNQYNLLYLGIEQNMSYDVICARCSNVPWSRREYYAKMRQFFWELDQIKMEGD